ncbi:MAG: MATE family efflux transporter [Acetatifactor sp.]|nr:MATE family efflux transporter [Acetatifactor sp.]
MNNDMTKGKILPALIRFTIPILIGDVFQQLYNIVDTIIVGRTLGAGALGAVGATGTLMFLILGFIMTLGAGFAVVTSQRFGAHDEEGVRKSFASAIILMTGFGIILTVLSSAFLDPLLRLMNTPEDIYADSYSYISVICGGLLAPVFYNLLATNLRAIGNSKIPLYFLILSSFLNIALDFVFILTFKMGVAGAALATIVSQLISAVLCAIYTFIKVPELRPRKGDWKFSSGIVKSQLTIAIPMAMQTAITASGTVIMQAATNSFGSTAVSAITAANKCKNIFTQPFMSIGSSIATFTGQNYGAGDMKRVKEGVYTTAKIISVYAIIVAVLVYVLLPWELAIFIDDAAVIDQLMVWAKPYVLASASMFLLLAYIFVFRSAIQGVGKSVYAMIGGMIELLMRVILAFLALQFNSYSIAIWCDPGAWIGAGVFLTVVFFIVSNKMEKQLNSRKNQEQDLAAK